MKRTLLCIGATCALVLCGSAGALAGPGYDYSWTTSVTTINSDPVTYSNIPPNLPAGDQGKGTISLQGVGSNFAASSSNVIAAEVWGTSAANYKFPAQFTNDKYTLSLTITDHLFDPNGPGAPGQSGVLTFQGELSGTVWTHGSLLTNTFIGPTTKSIVLGGELYTVTVGPFLPPGPHGMDNPGGIGATISLSPTPEPSTLVLAGLGMSLAGLATWRKRRQLVLTA